MMFLLTLKHFFKIVAIILATSAIFIGALALLMYAPLILFGALIILLNCMIWQMAKFNAMDELRKKKEGEE